MLAFTNILEHTFFYILFKITKQLSHYRKCSAVRQKKPYQIEKTQCMVARYKVHFKKLIVFPYCNNNQQDILINKEILLIL